MRVNIGLENNNEGRSLAWTLDHFGCIGYGPDGQSAVMSMAKAIPDYIAWMESHTSTPWFNPADIDIRLVEIVDDYEIDHQFNVVPENGRLIKAWFKTDWKPVSQTEMEQAIQILAWSRKDMLKLTDAISDSELDRGRQGEKMTIREILGHIGRAEWWLMDRLDRSHDRALLAEDPLERYAKERGWLLANLPDLIDLQQVTGKDGELWSPRKVLRRLCWHELDHIQHIKKLINL